MWLGVELGIRVRFCLSFCTVVFPDYNDVNKQTPGFVSSGPESFMIGLWVPLRREGSNKVRLWFGVDFGFGFEFGFGFGFGLASGFGFGL